jgi:hypothetical protein
VVTTRWCAGSAALLALPLAVRLVAAQQALPAADQYDPVFDQLQKMEPRGDRVAPVHDLTLRRDAIELHLDEGKLYLTTPVGGRTVGAVFVGHGSVSCAPPLAVERRQLQRVLGDSVLDSRITAAAFFFTDSTPGELEHRLSFGAGAAAGEAAGTLHDALDHLLDGKRREVVQSSLIKALLNGAVNGFFYVQVKRERGEDLMLKVDPGLDEQVELLRGGRQGRKVRIVSQFRQAADRTGDAASPDTIAPSPAARSATADPLALDGVRVEATITKGLGFSAVATIDLSARAERGPWARFELFHDLQVDSVRDAAGTDAFVRPKTSDELWIRFDRPLHAGEKRSMRIAYHGDVIGSTSVVEGWLRRGLPPRMADSIRASASRDSWTYIKDSQTWFPRYPTSWGWYATNVELTFHTPTQYRLASIGRLAESRVQGDVTTTRWVTERPAEQVCFSVGEFDEFKITDPRIPPVTVHINSQAHRVLFRLLPLSQQDPEKDVAGDVANSLAFFSRVYGPPLYDQYYATEILGWYGQAFPGLMYLSLATFNTVSESGNEETFRAHEMAHQWWGIGVEPAGYRDVWLSEGFADFSGLWYTQFILNDNDKFFKQLRERREAIRARRNDAPPIALGWRVADTDVPQDYSLIIYQKGSWVLHMLRNMMIDFRTMKEDAFTGMMQDFYRQYRGRRASTADFQRVVESHIGIPMDWFFREWVEGTAIPTYTLSWRAEAPQGGRYPIHLRIRQEDVPSDFEMPVPVRIVLAGGAEAFIRVTVRGPVTEGTFSLPGDPKEVELNPLESVLAQVKTESWR